MSMLILARARRACRAAERIVKQLIRAEYLPDTAILFEWNVKRLKRVRAYAGFIRLYEQVCAFARLGEEGSIIPVGEGVYVAYAHGRKVRRVALREDDLVRLERVVREFDRVMPHGRA